MPTNYLLQVSLYLFLLIFLIQLTNNKNPNNSSKNQLFNKITRVFTKKNSYSPELTSDQQNLVNLKQYYNLDINKILPSSYEYIIPEKLNKIIKLVVSKNDFLNSFEDENFTHKKFLIELVKIIDKANLILTIKLNLFLTNSDLDKLLRIIDYLNHSNISSKIVITDNNNMESDNIELFIDFLNS